MRVTALPDVSNQGNALTDANIVMREQQCEQSLCLLCGGSPDMVGIFSPPDSRDFGAAPGKARQFFYSICNNCLETDGLNEQVRRIVKRKSKSMKWR